MTLTGRIYCVRCGQFHSALKDCVECVVQMQTDETRVREIIRETIQISRNELDNAEALVRRILTNLDAENFKIVKRTSIGGEIG